MYVYTLHGIVDKRLCESLCSSYKLGMSVTPVRVVDCGDHIKAIEGTHRLFAMSMAGMSWEEVENHLIFVDNHDIINDHDCEEVNSECTAEDLLCYGSYTDFIRFE